MVKSIEAQKPDIDGCSQTIKDCWQVKEKEIGHTDPAEVADLVGQAYPDTHALVERSFYRAPTEEHLYPGAKETLFGLLVNGDHVKIWTQGHERYQLWKVANSGIGSVRKALPAGERSRFSVFTAQDKVAPLKKIISGFQNQGINQVVIIDDKAQNIVKLTEQADWWKQEGQIDSSFKIVPVWINQGRSKNIIPQEYTLETFKAKYKTIEDIRDLTKVREDLLQATQDNSINTAWLIDWDHTLCNTSEARQSLFDTLATKIAPSVQETLL